MMYILVNVKSGFYFKREQANGKCVDVDMVNEARIFYDKHEAESKANFIDKDINDGYYVKCLCK